MGPPGRMDGEKSLEEKEERDRRPSKSQQSGMICTVHEGHVIMNSATLQNGFLLLIPD